MVEEQKDFLKHKWKALWSKTVYGFVIVFAICWFANFETFRFASYISITWDVSYYNTILFGTTEGVTPSTVYWVVTPRALDQVMTLQSASRLPWPSKGSQRRPR